MSLTRKTPACETARCSFFFPASAPEKYRYMHSETLMLFARRFHEEREKSFKKKIVKLVVESCPEFH